MCSLQTWCEVIHSVQCIFFQKPCFPRTPGQACCCCCCSLCWFILIILWPSGIQLLPSSSWSLCEMSHAKSDFRVVRKDLFAEELRFVGICFASLDGLRASLVNSGSFPLRMIPAGFIEVTRLNFGLAKNGASCLNFRQSKLF